MEDGGWTAERGRCGLGGPDRCGTESQGRVGCVKPSDAVTPPSFPLTDGGRSMNITGPHQHKEGGRMENLNGGTNE